MLFVASPSQLRKVVPPAIPTVDADPKQLSPSVSTSSLPSLSSSSSSSSLPSLVPVVTPGNDDGVEVQEID